MHSSSRGNLIGLLAVVLGQLAGGLVVSAVHAQPTGPRSDSKPALSVNDPAAFQGYSLVSPMNSTTTYLIDMEGRVVKSWKSQYTPGLSAYLLPNGHLLRAGSVRNPDFHAPGNGGSIQEFSWDGELLWDYTFEKGKIFPHHDICPLPNGNVLAICWDTKTAAESIAAGRHPKDVRDQFLPDCLLEIKPTGKKTGEIVWQWHAWDHLVQELDSAKANYGEVAKHPELIDINYGMRVLATALSDPKELAKLRALGYVAGGPSPDNKVPDNKAASGTNGDKPGSKDRGRDDGKNSAGRAGGGGPRRGGPPFGELDWMHANSVDYNADLDQILISIHEFSEIWIIDHGTTTAEAASHHGGKRGMGGDLLYRWGNARAYRNGSKTDQRLFAQHCAHWIPKGTPGEGHVLVFNNGEGRVDGRYSTVDEIVPPLDDQGGYTRSENKSYGPDQPAWSYIAAEKGDFFSGHISGAQRLPNGNTLICNGEKGVLFEVTPEKKTVWRFAPPNLSDGGFHMPSFADALGLSRKQADEFEKLQKEFDQRLAKLLTDQQKTKLDAMKRGMGGGSVFAQFPLGGPGGGPGGPGPNFGPPVAVGFTGGPSGPGGGPNFGSPGPGGPDDGGPNFGPPGDGGGPNFGPPGGGTRGGPNFGPPGGGRMGGPGGRPGPGGPGGLFTSYRYAPTYPGLAGKKLIPGKRFEDVADQDRPR